MSLDLAVVAEEWRIVLLGLVAYTLLKGAGIYAVARAFRASRREALHRTALMAQGGEFAFVLYAAALGEGLIDTRGNAMLTATVILSMVLTPLLVALHDRIETRPNIAAYLASPRRMAFNDKGIFRHYPELDTPG